MIIDRDLTIDGGRFSDQAERWAAALRHHLPFDQLGAAKANIAKFAPGERTHWHIHDRGQLLFVKTGRAFVQVRDGAGMILEAGDAAWLDPAEEHWHGALPDGPLICAATSFGVTGWRGPVRETEYEGALLVLDGLLLEGVA